MLTEMQLGQKVAEQRGAPPSGRALDADQGLRPSEEERTSRQACKDWKFCAQVGVYWVHRRAPQLRMLQISKA